MGRLREATSQRADYEGLFSARLELDVRIISSATGEILDQFDLDGSGVAFSERDARTQALQRLSTALAMQLAQRQY